MAKKRRIRLGSSVSTHRGAARLALGTLRRFEKMIDDHKTTCVERLAAYAAWNQYMGMAHSELYSTGDRGKARRLGSYMAKRQGKLRDKVLLKCER